MLAKLQQTRSMQQAILSLLQKDGDTLEAATPDYEGYTKKFVQKILGEPENVLNDPKYLVETFSEKERENLVKLYQEGHLTDEQLVLLGWCDRYRSSHQVRSNVHGLYLQTGPSTTGLQRR